MVRDFRCTVKIDSILENSKKQNALLFSVNAMFHHDYHLAVKPASTPRRLVHKKTNLRDSLPIDMVVSAVSVLVVAQPNSEIPEGLKNYLYIEANAHCIKSCNRVLMWNCNFPSFVINKFGH
jgi:hypothetical protein